MYDKSVKKHKKKDIDRSSSILAEDYQISPMQKDGQNFKFNSAIENEKAPEKTFSAMNGVNFY